MSLPLEKTDPAEGTVDWNAAEEFMRGKPGDDDPEAGEASETPEAREFKYRGKTVKVDAETHSILEDLRREARGANGRLGSELARTRERLATLEGRLAAPQPTKPDDEPQPPDPLLATKDIAAWQRQYDAYHTAKMARQMADLEQRYTANVQEIGNRVVASQKEKEWADQFYSSYDHLDSPEIKPVVAQVYTEHKAEIDAFGADTEGAYDRLAELADDRLVRLRKAGKDTETTTTRRPPRIESAAGATPRGKPEEKVRDFSAASWVARQRLKMQGREPKEK